MSKSYKARMAAGEAFARMHGEPDADERGGRSDGDADNGKAPAKFPGHRAPKLPMAPPRMPRRSRGPIRRPAGLPSGQRGVLD